MQIAPLLSRNPGTHPIRQEKERAMTSASHLLESLCENIQERSRGFPVPFHAFLELSAKKPALIFRDIFQVFHDMVEGYVGTGVDEYPDDPESINFVYYDCSRLFLEGADHPFFADRLFANRFVNHVASFLRGAQQNRIYIFEGPHGCGKSTFLNNLLLKFEQFANTEDGASYEAVWRLDKKELGSRSETEAHALLLQLRALADEDPLAPVGDTRERLMSLSRSEYLEVPCPSHDNPLLLIPKSYRRDFLDGLIEDDAFKEKLFSEKQYEWVFRANPCTICMSLYNALLDILDSPARVFDMLFARRYQFNRRLGEGISVFNPGDKGPKNNVLTDPFLQNQMNHVLRDSHRVRYLYSRYAKTNNGVYALMDIKDQNRERLAKLHGIISEGVHKVEDIEENVNSLFLALMNPEDRDKIGETQSFSDRIVYIKIPYVLDYNTEVKIYESVFGKAIEQDCVPRVLQNFAKVIISTRLTAESAGMLEWIGSSEKYNLYCDRNLHLLKMDIYTGIIPAWLTEEDRTRFTAKRRKRIIGESEFEGDRGLSGRDSIKIFGEFYSTYAKRDKPVTMGMLCHFFQKYTEVAKQIPEGFLDSLLRSYNYAVLQEIKESLYDMNEEQIARDIQNYVFSINFEIGRVERCVYTGQKIEITEDFLETLEQRFLGPGADKAQKRSFRTDVQNRYTSRTLTQDMLVEGKDLQHTELYASLHERYIYNLKEKVMEPFLKNPNFRSAVKDYGRDEFKTYDGRIRHAVSFLVGNLMAKYGYTEQGAREVCIYVIDNELSKGFPKK
jgi:predicted Ser/Thr protein kinase